MKLAVIRIVFEAFARGGEALQLFLRIGLFNISSNDIFSDFVLPGCPDNLTCREGLGRQNDSALCKANDRGSMCVSRHLSVITLKVAFSLNMFGGKGGAP